ncbi:hypothetical protein ACLX1H_010274 [Fusarium chlamydosporum]
MKFTIPLLVAFVGTQVNAECVDGHREVVSPGYTVEYTCNKAKLGDPAVSASSEGACAEICRDAGRSICTYNARRGPGSILMTKVDEPEPDIEDPFVEVEETDPFAADCEDEKSVCLEREKKAEAGKKACLDREKKLKAERDSVKAEKVKVDARMKDLMASNCPSQHTRYGVVNKREYRFFCGRHHEPEGYKEELPNIYTMADCVDQCSRKAWCNHVLHGIFQNKCRLYESPKVSATTTPALYTHVWNCAVKK